MHQSGPSGAARATVARFHDTAPAWSGRTPEVGLGIIKLSNEDPSTSTAALCLRRDLGCDLRRPSSATTRAWVDWVSVIGLPLTLLGLFLTWQQARNASTAAQAAEKAVSRTERQIRASQILVLVPQLRSTVAELETAIEKRQCLLLRAAAAR